jgi:hypothetical protein
LAFVETGEVMNDLPRQKLRELIAEHGPGLCDDPRRCNALLKEQCGTYKQEIRVLVGALNEEITDELLTAPADAPRPELLDRLRKQLQDALDISEADARWGVESWALALGVITAPAAEPPPAETAPPAEAPAAASPSEGAAPPAPRVEQPACFYLGREYDLASHSVQADRPVLYDARDLLTHGVVVGMTGSGKTGLCINLIEEAALDGVPCVLIDPKGDLTNLLLQFPELRPQDFLPWLNPEDARQKGLKLEEHARQLADRWRKGLEESGQTPERIARLKASADFRIYTPGSEAGLPLSILQNFAAPKGPVTGEALNQKVAATTTALLGLTGLAGDPVQSREHILIAQLLLQAWKKGRDVDLAQLISEIQSPSLRKIGTLDVDTFYPEKERLKLAVALNNILASPSFATWITGEPLDLGRMLYAPDGKPRQLIFYVAHLDDAQRMFFVTLLLEEVLAWTRKQPGTTGLRAVVYFDEVFGYLPPHPHNPPSKGPLMRLLKQARAFGIGILLATQNPVDLDYKALSNAGTWFVGKLQTERDKARLLEGLEGVAAERGTLTNRNYLETVISALGNRVFLLHDVHRGQPVLFQSRWALSFLRGPLTPDQVTQLTDRVRAEPPAASGAAPAAAIPLCPRCRAALPTPAATTCPGCGAVLAQPVDPAAEQEFKQALLRAAAPSSARTAAPPAEPVTHVAPVLAGVTQYYVALGNPVRPVGSAELVYQPRLLGGAEVVFADRRRNLEYRRTYRYLAVPPAPGEAANWHAAEPFTAALAEAPESGARWADVTESLNTAKKLTGLKRGFTDFLYGNAKFALYVNGTLELVSAPGEDAPAFQERCREGARRAAERALDAEKRKYEPKFRVLHAEMPDPAAEKQGDSWWSNLSLGLFGMGWASPRPPTRLPAKEQAKLDALEDDWRKKWEEIRQKWQRAGEEYTELQLTPRKTDIQVTHFGLAWVPFWSLPAADGRPDLRPAYR